MSKSDLFRDEQKEMDSVLRTRTVVTRRLDGDTRTLDVLPGVTCSEIGRLLYELAPDEYPLYRTRVMLNRDSGDTGDTGDSGDVQTEVAVYVHPPVSLESSMDENNSQLQKTVLYVPWTSPPLHIFVTFVIGQFNRVMPMYVAKTVDDTTTYFGWEASLYHAIRRVMEPRDLTPGVMMALYHEIRPHLHTMVDQRRVSYRPFDICHYLSEHEPIECECGAIIRQSTYKRGNHKYSARHRRFDPTIKKKRKKSVWGM